jgi:biopolymer transport protein ExbD
MAMSMPQEGGGDNAPMADINTTPLVDVMLVLLIIFLITVPVAIQTVHLELPKVVNQPTTTKPENANISVKATGGNCEAYWGTQRVDNNQQLRDFAGKKLLADVKKQQAAGAKIELPEVHVRGDAGMPYKCAGGVIYAMQQAGYQKIAFVSEPPAGTAVTR